MGKALQFDTEDWRKVRDDHYRRWFKGDEYAVQTIHVLMNACEFWDDLIDQDAEITPDRVDIVFRGIFVDLTVNPFWQRTRAFLEPLIIMAINAWMDANELSKSNSEKERNLAFHIRNLPTELVMAVAFGVGGWEHMRSVSVEARRFFAHESFDEWEHRR